MYQRLESLLVSTRNLEDVNASTNVSINDKENCEFTEGVSGKRQVKKSLGTKRTINIQEEAVH